MLINNNPNDNNNWTIPGPNLASIDFLTMRTLQYLPVLFPSHLQSQTSCFLQTIHVPQSLANMAHTDFIGSLERMLNNSEANDHQENPGGKTESLSANEAPKAQLTTSNLEAQELAPKEQKLVIDLVSSEDECPEPAVSRKSHSSLHLQDGSLLQFAKDGSSKGEFLKKANDKRGSEEPNADDLQKSQPSYRQLSEPPTLYSTDPVQAAEELGNPRKRARSISPSVHYERPEVAGSKMAGRSPGERRKTKEPRTHYSQDIAAARLSSSSAEREGLEIADSQDELQASVGSIHYQHHSGKAAVGRLG